MIALKRITNGLSGPDGIAIERTVDSQLRFSEWHQVITLTDPLREAYGLSRRFLPVSKLPQVIAVLRLNGIEVELGEGL